MSMLSPRRVAAASLAFCLGLVAPAFAQERQPVVREMTAPASRAMASTRTRTPAAPSRRATPSSERPLSLEVKVGEELTPGQAS